MKTRTSCVLLLVLLALACRKTAPAAGGAATGGRDSAPGPALAPDAAAADAAAQGDEAGPSSVAAAAGDAFAPAIVPFGEGWIVAWTEDDGQRTRILVNEAESLDSNRPPHVIAEGPSAWGVRLAVVADAALAAWIEGEASRAVRVARIDGYLDVAGDVRTVSHGGTPVGPPGIAAFGAAFVVAWVEGSKVYCARIGRDGSTVEEASWPGGNIRPTRFGGREPQGAAGSPAEVERANPYPSRPVIVASGDAPRVFWWGEYWESDDMGGESLYEHAVAWPDAGGEPAALQDLPVWASLEALAPAAGGRWIAVQASHNPNGGPWELSARLEGSEAGPPFTSEPAGPLPVTIAPAGTGFVAAWPSPTYGGVAFARIQPDGTAGRVTAVPAAAPPGWSDVAVAAVGDVVRAAYVDVRGGRSVVRAADPTTAEPARAVEPAVRGTELTALERHRAGDLVSLGLGSGGTLLAWEGDDGASTRLYALRLDATGSPAGEVIDLTPGEPRCEAPSVGALGDTALVAYHCTADRSGYGRSEARLASFGADGGRPKVVRVAGGEPIATYPALAVSADRVGLVVLRGEYDSRRAEVRVASVGDAGDPGAALRAAREVVLPANDGDAVGGPAAAWSSAGLVVAFLDRAGPGTARATRFFLVPPEGEPTAGVALDELGYGTWGPHRLASLPDGVAFVGTRGSAGSTDTVVWILAPDAASIVRRIVVGRGLVPVAPFALSAGGSLGVAWFDRRTDGNYVAFLGADGVRRGGPVRLDDPAIRAAVGSPSLVSAGGPDRWRAWWTDTPAVYTAEIAMP